jgi:bifunctional DNA-binding transcriptional regulator/antitoxin component of YhaV-PrlF toxin-antitoxin module
MSARGIDSGSRRAWKWETCLAMRTKLSTNGRVVLSRQLLEQLGLKPGAVLDAKLGGGRIVLTPKQGRRRKATMIIDPISGLPALTFGPGAPILTNKQVQKTLSDFP